MNLLKNKEVTYGEWNSLADVIERIEHMCSFVYQNINANPEICSAVIDEITSLSEVEDYAQGKILSYDLRAYFLWHEGKTELAFDLLDKSTNARQSIHFYDQIGWNYMTKGMLLWQQGDYDSAFSNMYDGLRFIESRGVDKFETIPCYWTLGVFHYDLKNYDLSLENYYKVFEAIEENTNAQFTNNIYSYTLIGIGCCLKEKGDFDGALNYFEQAKVKSWETNQWMQEARSLYEIGLVQTQAGICDEAERSLQKSFEMRQQHNTKPGMVSCLLALTDLKLLQGELKAAVQYANNALALAKETNSKMKVYLAHYKLYELQKQQQNFEEALMHLEAYQEIRAQVVGEETTNKIKDLETKFATESAEKEAEIERLKNEEILSSIRYAQRIQNSILPSEDLIKQTFDDHFIIYLPKDIVAGDFYWIERKEEKVYFSAADCTGHGVPGALVSVMCSNTLNKALIESENGAPGDILDKTASILESRLKSSKETVDDGMDLSLCCYDTHSGLLSVAGANNPIYVIKNGELIEIKGDKQPIGSYENRQAFSTHEVSISKGDLVYSFTDGYADQFGGPKGKKLRYNVFKELLVDSASSSLEEQKNRLIKYFNDWKGEEEQVDDVCIIGIRF